MPFLKFWYCCRVWGAEGHSPSHTGSSQVGLFRKVFAKWHLPEWLVSGWQSVFLLLEFVTVLVFFAVTMHYQKLGWKTTHFAYPRDLDVRGLSWISLCKLFSGLFCWGCRRGHLLQLLELSAFMVHAHILPCLPSSHALWWLYSSCLLLTRTMGVSLGSPRQCRTVSCFSIKLPRIMAAKSLGHVR